MDSFQKLNALNPHANILSFFPSLKETPKFSSYNVISVQGMNYY